MYSLSRVSKWIYLIIPAPLLRARLCARGGPEYPDIIELSTLSFIAQNTNFMAPNMAPNSGTIIHGVLPMHLPIPTIDNNNFLLHIFARLMRAISSYTYTLEKDVSHR